MKSKVSALLGPIGGVFLLALLVLASLEVVRGQGETPSTGNAELHTLEAGYHFSFSADPGVEVLKYASAGGMSGVTTAYVLYGDGKLVFREMGEFSEIPVIETYEGDPVIYRAEADLSFRQMRLMVRIPVVHALLETSQEEILEQMGVTSWHTTDMGTQTLEVHLARYGSRGSGHGPIDFVIDFEDPDKAARHFPEIGELKGITRLRALMNLELGFVSPEPTPEE